MKMEPDENRALLMLTVAETAKMLRLSESQVRTLLRAGHMPGVQFKFKSRAKWLIPRVELKTFIAKELAKTGVDGDGCHRP
jgi:excisionase family DNA binding protein